MTRSLAAFVPAPLVEERIQEAMRRGGLARNAHSARRILASLTGG